MSEVEGETELQVRPLSSSGGGRGGMLPGYRGVGVGGRIFAIVIHGEYSGAWMFPGCRGLRGGGEDVCHCDSLE